MPMYSASISLIVIIIIIIIIIINLLLYRNRCANMVKLETRSLVRKWVRVTVKMIKIYILCPHLRHSHRTKLTTMIN